MFLISSSSVGSCDVFEVEASWGSVGVCRPDAAADAGFEGAREGMVRLSLVKRRDVIIT